MAATAIKISGPGAAICVLVETIPQENDTVIVHINRCENENFIPTGEADATAFEKTEEEYHRDLRQEAALRGHFVASHSTNPEWNPKHDMSDDQKNKSSSSKH